MRMQVVFGLGFGGGAWPGALAASGRDAAFNQAWVGPLGLLKILETTLGLVGPDESGAERAAALVPALRARAGPWSRSLEADALAVARSILRTRDALVDAGLPPGDAPAALGARLQEILIVSQGARPGVPDRLVGVARALEEGARAEVESIALVEARAGLSPAWARVMAALEARGTRIEELGERALLEDLPASAEGATDLAAARRGPFAPALDGSLQLVRGDCPEETAIELAAHLTRVPLEEVLVIGADAVLDASLARMGLPTTGARGARGDDGLLQIAPLVVALAWPERDPERAFELLCLSTSPIRRTVAARLARSLLVEPAVGGARWEAELAASLAAIEDEAQRAEAAARVARIFGGPGAAGAERLPVKLLDERLALLRRWLFGRARREGDELKFRSALAQVAAIGRIARGLGGETLTRTDLMRVVEQATAAVRPRTPRPALAGVARVADPAAIAGPVQHVVWWRFTRESEPVPRALVVSSAERRALSDLGVVLPLPAARAEQRALAWARPLFAARASLVLGCPRRNAAGEEAHPHPLWDEIAARAGTRAARRLEVRRIIGGEALPSKTYRARELPRPQREWRFPAGSVAPPDKESPSSREVLLGCGFRAVLKRAGVSERSRRLPEGTQLFGVLAHDVLARLLQGWPIEIEEAAERARVIFDERLPRVAAALLRPVERSQRTRARETIAQAASAITEALHARGLTVHAVEQDVALGSEGRVLKGRPDLVVRSTVDGGLAVIDFKSGSDSDRLRALEQGTAVQLALYAQLVRGRDAPWPAIAYFQIRSRRLLTTAPELGGAQTVESPYAVDDIARRLKRAGRHADDEIAAGRAAAPGVGARLSELRSRIEGEEILIAPPCRFCSFGFLCGRALPNGGGR
jgi:ATP-dependent helicase/nuclease subunit B